MICKMEIRCYICYESETAVYPFAVQPCVCKGSLKVHTICLEKLLETDTSCKICDTEYRVKPIYKHSYYSDGVLASSTAYFRNGMYYIIQYDSNGHVSYVRRPFNAYEYDIIMFHADETIYSIHYYTTNTDKTVLRIPIEPENYDTHWNNTICLEMLAKFGDGEELCILT